MITICATPKPFNGHIGIIQENAIRSWLANPGIEVMLLGDEKGTKEIAEKYKCLYEPNIFTNSNGTPLLDSIFEVIQEKAPSDIICYTSADVMMFFNNFKIDINGPFLGMGYRHDCRVDKLLEFKSKDEFGELKKHGASACDYWIFPKGMYPKFPPFTVGRGAQEGWMIWHAQKHKVPVIDMSNHIIAIHQDHDYSHLTANMNGWWVSPEYKENVELAGGIWHIRTLKDLDYYLINGEVKKIPITPYKIIFNNPIGQWLLGLKRWIRYKELSL